MNRMIRSTTYCIAVLDEIERRLRIDKATTAAVAAVKENETCCCCS